MRCVNLLQPLPDSMDVFLRCPTGSYYSLITRQQTDYRSLWSEFSWLIAIKQNLPLTYTKQMLPIGFNKFYPFTDKNAGSLGCFGWVLVIISLLFIAVTFPITLFLCVKVRKCSAYLLMIGLYLIDQHRVEHHCEWERKQYTVLISLFYKLTSIKCGMHLYFVSFGTP